MSKRSLIATSTSVIPLSLFLTSIDPYLQQIDPSNPFFAILLISKKDLCSINSDEEVKKIDCRHLKCTLFKQSGLSDAELSSIKKKFFASAPQSSAQILSILDKNVVIFIAELFY